MNEPIIIDAKGLSCPRPVLLTKKTLDSIKLGNVKIFVDTVTSRENVTRYGKNAGWDVTFEAQEEGFCIHMKKER